MKKLFRLVALVMAGSLIFVACGKDNENKGGKDNKDNKGNTEQKGSAPEITLDGAFADWDAITEANVKDNDFTDFAKSTDADDPIQVMKMTCDEDNIYFYIEWNTAGLPQNASCSEWGDSWNGTPEGGYSTPDANHPDDDTFRETVFFYIDPDGNDRTGFYTFEGDTEGEPAIPGLGCEMGVCWFAFYNYETKKVCMAWNQNNVGPYMLCLSESGAAVGDPYGVYDYNGTFFLSWPDSGQDAAWPLWGWLNYDGTGRGDNLAPRKDNWFPAAADGTKAKLEFAVEKRDITNLPDDAEEIAVGIQVKWGSVEQCVGPLRISYVE